MHGTKEQKIKHLEEIDSIFQDLFDKLNLKIKKKNYLNTMFRLLGAKDLNQSTHSYRRNNSINKKVIYKMELLQRLLEN